MKLLVVTQSNEPSSLEYSYTRALRELNYETEVFNFYNAFKEFLPFKKFHKLVQYFAGQVDYTTAINKTNIKLTKHIIQNKYDAIIFFTNIPLNPSTLVYLSSIGIKTAMVYPDAIVNMAVRNSACIPFYDVILSYSQTGVTAFEKLGNKNVVWCPLAADHTSHFIESAISDVMEYDISFIGNYRPEREEMLSMVIRRFPELRIKIIGNWIASKDQYVKSKAENKQLYGKEYASFIHHSYLSLNIIDQTNYPAANMRFFEIPISGGMQICSPCPEMETTFLHHEHILYYKDANELFGLIEYCFKNKEAINEIKKKSQRMVLENHLYIHRVKQLLHYIGK